MMSLVIFIPLSLLAISTVAISQTTTTKAYDYNDPNYRNYLNDCFSENSICVIYSSELSRPCDDALGDHSNYTAWTKCHCESGWLSARQA